MRVCCHQYLQFMCSQADKEMHSSHWGIQLVSAAQEVDSHEDITHR